eukprot:g46499.t1
MKEADKNDKKKRRKEEKQNLRQQKKRMRTKDKTQKGQKANFYVHTDPVTVACSFNWPLKGSSSRLPPFLPPTPFLFSDTYCLIASLTHREGIRGTMHRAPPTRQAMPRKKQKLDEISTYLQELAREKIKPYRHDLALQDHKAWLAEFDAQGFCVIENAISGEEVSLLHELLDADLRLINPLIDPRDPATWTNSNWPGINSIGIIKDSKTGIQHGRFMWTARQLAWCSNIFQRALGIEPGAPCLASFDTCSVFRDFAYNRAYKTKDAWPHMDKGTEAAPALRGRRCLQGILCLTDTSFDTGGFAVVAGSQKLHADVVKIMKPRKGVNYVSYGAKALEIQKEVFDRHGLVWYMPHVRAGSMILFDSAVTHTNIPARSRPSKPPPATNTTWLRVAAFINLVPASILGADELAKVRRDRENFVQKGAQTNHYITYDTRDKPMAVSQQVAYPRHKSFQPLQSCALSAETIMHEYSALVLGTEHGTSNFGSRFLSSSHLGFLFFQFSNHFEVEILA